MKIRIAFLCVSHAPRRALLSPRLVASIDVWIAGSRDRIPIGGLARSGEHKDTLVDAKSGVEANTDVFALHPKTKNLHWRMKGNHFHRYLETVYRP
jgi:hypothetical protein